jgi:hypothetical protein
MICFVIFEKKAENDRPVWTLELVRKFCEEQNYTVYAYSDELGFIVTKLLEEELPEHTNYRLLELTKTITFIIKDDPSLDDILVPEASQQNLLEAIEEKEEEEQKEIIKNIE